MGFWDDINPLNLINALNDAIGSSMADVLEFLGISDPAVDPDGIREIAKAWQDLAHAVGDANFAAGQATTGIALQGQAGKAFAERVGKVRGIATQVETALHQGHDGLNKLADQSHELISQVGVLCAQIAEFEVAGLALSVLTGPLSDAAAVLASGTRARRIVEIFAEVEAMVVRAGKMIEDLCSEIGGLARVLKALQSIAKLGLRGAKTAVAWDAMFNPGNLTDPSKLETDMAFGAGGEIGFAALGKGFTGLRNALGKLGLEGADGAGLFGEQADGALADIEKELKDNGYLPHSGAQMDHLIPDYEELTPEDLAAMDAYAAIRGQTGDVASIAENTGIDADVLARIKQHIFFDEHTAAINLGDVATGRFRPHQYVADMWNKAAAGALPADEQAAFLRWATHEGIESQLMKDGMPYCSDSPLAWDNDLKVSDTNHTYLPTPEAWGAHDISPHETHADPFLVWRRRLGLGDQVPDWTPAPDLSNLGDLLDVINKIPRPRS